jgi:uncharacterized protein
VELCLVVDHACNLRCRYCYGGEKRAAPLADDTIERSVEIALSENTGWLSVTLFGGEPLVRPGILPRIGRIVERALTKHGQSIPLRWLLDTNATLIDDEALDWLAGPRSARVFASLDGPASVHDRHRVDANGRGSHARALGGIRRLGERGIPLEIVAVVSPATADALGESLAHLAELGAERITFQPDLRARWQESDLVGFRRGVRQAARLWADRFRAGRPVLVDPLHTKVLSHIIGGHPCPARCQLLTREMAVAPSGRIYPCAEMVCEDRPDSPLAAGDVFAGIDATRVAELRRRSSRVQESCGDCDLRYRCQHHCACRQLASTGELGRVSSLVCEIESAWIDAADRAAEELVAEDCRTFQDFYYRGGWAISAGAHTTDDLVPLRVRRK